MNARAVAVGVSLLAALLAATSCDPCFGVGNCGTDPRIAIEGTIVEQASGQPSPGVRVDVIRTGGVSLGTDSSSTVSGADGHWQIGVSAHDVGDVTVDVNVYLPNVATYRVRDLHVTASDRRGDGLVLPTWVVNPYFAFSAELFYQSTQDTRVEGATVEFHRTGGIEYYLSNGGQVFVGQTDAAGRLNLFGVFGHTTSLGDLIGDLVVHLPPPFAADTIRNLHLAATQLLHAETQIIRLGIVHP